MAKRKNRIQDANRLAWIVIFLSVSAALAWAELSGESGSGVGWFLAVSLWSAVCGIGFSIGDCLLGGKSHTAGHSTSSADGPPQPGSNKDNPANQ